MVGIKNFVMPEYCEECKFYNNEGNIFEKFTCILTDVDLSKEISYTISDTCPLIVIATE